VTYNKDLGTVIIHNYDDYRKLLIKQEQEREKDSITESVIDDLDKRSARGWVKYKTTLGKNNHQNMLQHAYEEALDLAQYLKKEITTFNTIQDLVRLYPNDNELGAKVRELYSAK
jgi:predicted phage-related endonuclease